MTDIVYSYTRTQAIEDGVLIDVSRVAKEAGIKYPTAVTAAVWEKYVCVPDTASWQDEQGRLWDIVWMLRYAIVQADDTGELRFSLVVQNDDLQPELVTLKVICAAGDDSEPVITVMLPNED